MRNIYLCLLLSLFCIGARFPNIEVYSSGGSSGNIGVGTTVPTEKIEVVGTVKATRFVGDGGGLTGITGASSQWLTNGVMIGTTGKVGIGSTAPSQMLDVVGTAKATAFVGPLTGNVTGDLTRHDGRGDGVFGSRWGWVWSQWYCN